MAEVQGTIIVSGNGKVNLTEILPCLNQYCWSDCDSKFALISNSIRFTPYADYPTTFPRREQFLEDSDGDQTDGSDTEDGYDFDESALLELAAAIHKHIGEGFIELSAVSNHQNYGAWFESLRIDADGVVKACRFGRSVLQAPADEEYFWQL